MPVEQALVFFSLAIPRFASDERVENATCVAFPQPSMKFQMGRSKGWAVKAKS
jgi:hypothetical protein